ncbi:MAG: hypothetical protein KC492_03940 [Myxococcales bacterium]|nr:hypothetical protein [Myxococcales bacterium]
MELTKRWYGFGLGALLVASGASCSANDGGASCVDCGANGGSAGQGATGGTNQGGTSQGGSGGDLIGSGGTAAGGGGSGGADVGQVFGHSEDTLYELEPFSKSVQQIGKFDCLNGLEMWDIAIDGDGRMVGAAMSISSGSLVEIDPSTAHCTPIASGSFPNSLTYIPAGVLDPTDEVLVGFSQGNYLRIDPLTGATTQIGSMNPNSTGTNWISSGDVVSLQGGGTYATVRPLLSGSTAIDSLVEIDPKTGQVLKVIGSTGFSQLWGLGFWAGTAYGFSANGQLVSIDLTTGAGTFIPLPSIPNGLSFWGAGTTTSAPVEPPR